MTIEMANGKKNYEVKRDVEVLWWTEDLYNWIKNFLALNYFNIEEVFPINIELII